MNVLGKGQKTKHPEQPIAKLNVPDARRVLPKGLPCLYLTIRQGILHEKLFQKPDKTLDEKERGRTFPKSTEQYFKQPFFPYSISIFRVSSRPSHFEQNN